MQHITEVKNLKLQNTAIALGKFDGFHRGHQLLLAQVLEWQKRGMTGVIFTFAPAGRQIGSGKHIDSHAEKVKQSVTKDTMENEHQFSQLVNNAKLDNVLSGTFKKQGTIDGDDGKKYTYEDYYVPLATTTYRFIFDDSSQLVMFGTQVTGKDMYYANLSFYETSADAFNVIESYQDASKLSASSSQTNNAG